MSSRFEERLANGPAIVGDGGMGVLVTSAVPRLRCPEEANLKAPESVVTLHTSFIRAGADLIETNTFGANRRKLAQLYLEDELERINGAGVKLAREAREVAGREVFIAGSIGPHHGAGLHAALAALEAMGLDGAPLAALPNVGLASLSGGRVIYPHATPEYFAEFAAHASRLGARLIGGCCGTTPVEIAAIRSAVEEAREPSAPLDVLERELPEPQLGAGTYETELARKFRESEWITCVELDPPKGGTYDAMLGVTRTLKADGVGFVDINDNPM